MPSSSPQPSQPDPLQPVLDDVEEELRRRLHEACEAEAKGLSTESTQQIRHLEDTLLAAAVAAEQTISVRRHMERRTSAKEERPTRIAEAADRSGNTNPKPDKSRDESTGELGKERDTSVREFIDDTGHTWRAWQVIPGLSRTSARGRGFLGNFQDGWICFEGLNTTARRRLPFRQPNWTNITDEELQRLLAQAIDAPGRATKRQDKPPN
jgi:hypothetical protein